jgi:endo-1,4-beta-mannosidase
MSGPNWAPEWLIDPAPRPPDARPVVVVGRGVVPGTIANIYVEPRAIAAAERQIAAVCGALAGHPAVWGWSLGNEPDLFCVPPDRAAGRAWVDRMVRAIHAVDPRPATIGLHTASLANDCNLRVDDLAPVTDFSVMNGYSIYSSIARRPLDPDWIPFSCALTAALAGRPVLCEELGLCTHDAPSGMRDGIFHASEEDAAAWWSAVLPRLRDTGATGAFAWCFADYPPSLWDRPPCDRVLHERRFGLVDGDGREKPSADAIRAFSRTRPVVKAAPRIEVDRERYFRDPWSEMARLYAAWPASTA